MVTSTTLITCVRERVDTSVHCLFRCLDFIIYFILVQFLLSNGTQPSFFF